MKITTKHGLMAAALALVSSAITLPAVAAPTVSDVSTSISVSGSNYNVSLDWAQSVNLTWTNAGGQLSSSESWRYQSTSITFYGSSTQEIASFGTSSPAGVGIMGHTFSTASQLTSFTFPTSNTSSIQDAYLRACFSIEINSTTLGANGLDVYRVCSATIPNPNLQAAGVLTSMPAFAFNGAVRTFFQPSIWSAGTQRIDYLVACTSPRLVAVTTPTTQATVTTGCRPLYTDNTGTVIATNLTTAYVSTGNNVFVPYVPATHGGYIAAVSLASSPSATGVSTATYEYYASSMTPDEPTPYTGPVVQAPGAIKPVAPGKKLTLAGSNLSGVSKATINGFDAQVKVNSAGEIEIVVPASLASGTYDLVLTSDSGALTVQDAIKVSNSNLDVNSEQPDVSTKLKADNTVKVYVTNVVGAGKVQIFLNGKEIAWVNTDNPNDAKLLNEYLVRTLELSEGKNIIEIYVNLKRVDRKAYTVVDDSSRI